METVTDAGCEKGVEKFARSYNGKHITNLSRDQKTEEKITKKGRKDDAMVYGERWDYVRLQSWILLRRLSRLCQRDKDMCMTFHGVRTRRASRTRRRGRHKPILRIGTGCLSRKISLEDHHVENLATFQVALENLTWVSGDLCWRGRYGTSSVISSKGVYKMSMAK